MEHCHRLLAAALLLLSLESGVLLLATKRGVGERRAQPDAAIERSGSNCPGYRPGVGLRGRPLRDCVTGSAAGRVDHELAFGFRGTDVDLRDCDLPEYPETNRRVCYRTTIDLCHEIEYRLYLNRRNFGGVLSNCPEEQEDLPESEDLGVIFWSPRYQCKKKKKGKFYQYRNKELCLYNISVPNCESGSVRIQTADEVNHELDDAAVNGECVDYLQFFYNSAGGSSLLQTNRSCGTSLFNDTIPATNLLAVFWTDTQNNNVGFKMRARCLETTTTTTMNNSENGSLGN